MNNNEFIEIETNTEVFINQLKEFDKDMPNIARKMLRAVNAEVKKAEKQEARARGYKAHNLKTFGDAGYMSNIFTYANKDYSAKVMMGRNAFHYRFIENGAVVTPQNHKYLVFKVDGKFYKSRGFILPARPFFKQIAKSFYETDKGMAIMDRTMQKEMARKYFKEN